MKFSSARVFGKGWAAAGLSAWLLSASASALADSPKVEITSFDYVNNAGRVAEICGRVSGAADAAIVRLTVDVHSSTPGIYHAAVGRDGLFCTLVASYSGSADASIESKGRSFESGVVNASGFERR